MAHRFIFEFIGGDIDGYTLDSETKDPVEQQLVQHCMAAMRDGKMTDISMALIVGIGQGSLRSESIHRNANAVQYEIVETLEENNETLIRLQHSLRIT